MICILHQIKVLLREWRVGSLILCRNRKWSIRQPYLTLRVILITIDGAHSIPTNQNLIVPLRWLPLRFPLLRSQVWPLKNLLMFPLAPEVILERIAASELRKLNPKMTGLRWGIRLCINRTLKMRINWWWRAYRPMQYSSRPISMPYLKQRDKGLWRDWEKKI